MQRRRHCRRLGEIALMLSLTVCPAAQAHVGSPDTFVQANAGPYPVLVATHPPAAYPGAMELDLRSNPDDRLTLASAWVDEAKPTPVRVFEDGTATASLWLPDASAHALHVVVQGTRGAGSLTIHLPAVAASRSGLRHLWLPPLAAGVVLLGAALALRRRKVLASLALAAACLALTAAWLSARITPRTTVAANLEADGRLDLTFSNPAEDFRDLVPDHGKMLHLFLVREPGQDVLLHLHPEQLAPGRFTVQLPAMPPGPYELFADFYHADGRNETAVLHLGLPPQSRTASSHPDDTFAVLGAVPDGASRAMPVHGAGRGTGRREGGAPQVVTERTSPDTTLRTALLADGYAIKLQAHSDLKPLRAELLEVTLVDPMGRPPADRALYLGMNAHAIVLRSDNGVFAHLHPGGTLPMAMPVAADGGMPGMEMPPPSNTATIPYGFPAPGQYRVFVQMKHGHTVETAAFDLEVR